MKTNHFPINSINEEAFNPDINFFNRKLDDIDSPYFSINQLIQFPSKLNKQTFSFFHLNVQSFLKNMLDQNKIYKT